MVQFGLVRYGTQLFALPLSKGYQRVQNNHNALYCAALILVTLLFGYQVVLKSVKEAGATHTQVLSLQAGKKTFLSVVVELLAHHFSKFYFFLSFFLSFCIYLFIGKNVTMYFSSM